MDAPVGTTGPRSGRFSRPRPLRGISWLFAILIAASPPPVASAAPAASVIVRGVPGALADAERAVAALGGTVDRRLPVIDGFAVALPADRIDDLSRVPGILTVTRDRTMRPLHAVDGYDPATDAGSLWTAASLMQARDLWSAGVTGSGVDVALIDTGVAPVNGMRAPGKLLHGPDLSPESQTDGTRHVDGFGHGTHMAGIIAGLDDHVATSKDLTDHHSFVGIAPGARLVSLKVAGRSGAADVSQVIAAIDWVVQNRNAHGLNIRVLSLSYGTDGTQDRHLDPLAYAVEVAWRRGIVVVAAAGNLGETRNGLTNPASNPFVIAVGADDTKGTQGVNDDIVPAWSGRGSGRSVDVVAPGVSVASLRAPGSAIDEAAPSARTGSRFFRGSGTSQATAMVAGAAALILQARPTFTPDQVKHALMAGAAPLKNAERAAQGAGLVRVADALRVTKTGASQAWARASGIGSLDAARGSMRVQIDGVELRGEHDIFGNPWDPAAWSAAAWNGTSWSGGDWNGATWTGTSWSGTSWSGATWSGTSWSGTSWSGTSWSGMSWSGTSWSGTSWSGTSWSAAGWQSAAWS